MLPPDLFDDLSEPEPPWVAWAGWIWAALAVAVFLAWWVWPRLSASG